MSDSNPTPRYGEYASPEQQREHIREPLPDYTALTPPAEPVRYPAVPQAGETRPANLADRWVTIGLLAWGAFSVLTTAFSLFDFAAIANQSYALMGIEGKFSNFAEGKTWGAIGAAVLLAGYALTVMLVMRRMRAKKITWFLPIIGAAVTFFVLTLCISVPLMGDPAFVDSLTSQRP